MIKVPISYGELVDKITILELKQRFIINTDKLININKELDLLNSLYENTISCAMIYDLKHKLYEVNEKLWHLEEKTRKLDNGSDRPDYTEILNISCGIHSGNDKRAAVKKEINIITNSEIVEEKSYD